MTDNSSADKHKARQEKIKQTVDDKIAAAQIERGIVLVLTGNGKGKSTAGFGTVTRSLGHGKKPAVVQFIKGNGPCGERNVLESLGVPFVVMATGFTWETQDKEKDKQAAELTWAKAKKMLADPELDLVLLDELTYMISYHYLEIDEVLAAINNRPEHQSVIITGRACHRKLLDIADTVSEVKPIKHAFEAGIKAQEGIDF